MFDRAMNIGTGADAFHNLLAQIAALGEVEGTSLRGLLCEVFLKDVDAIPRSSFGNSQNLSGSGSRWTAAVLCQRGPDGFNVFGSKPELKTRNRRAIRVNEGNRHPIPSRFALFEGLSPAASRPVS